MVWRTLSKENSVPDRRLYLWRTQSPPEAKALLKAAEVVRDTGSDVLGVVSIFNFEFPMSVKRLRDARHPHHLLTNYKT